MNIPRPEYPKQQFARKTWLNLNGNWSFEFDDSNAGIKEKWYKHGHFSRTIVVPYVYQSELSGINTNEFHDIIWYSTRFNLPGEMTGKRIILNFGAVDYIADIWVNGEHLARHSGGQTSFDIEITDNINEKDNLIVVRAADFSKDLELPRGKQYWKEKSEGIFYTPITGIWQTVWIDAVAQTYLRKVWITPEFDRKTVRFEYEVDGPDDITITAEVSYNSVIMAVDTFKVLNNRGKREIFIDQDLLGERSFTDGIAWTPENPRLFDVSFAVVLGNMEIDKVQSYFAMRKVSIENGKFMLNNRPYYQKLLLDQGYWEKSLLTAPTDDDFVKDIELCKSMGFNGVRKHQKLEDQRFLYWADKMGFLVWSEMASAYSYSKKYISRFTEEWLQSVSRDYNHPCIVVWVTHNESWGVDRIIHNKDEQSYSASLYYLTKAIDSSRPVISNDGWEHTKSDILTVHDYRSDTASLEKTYSSINDLLVSTPHARMLFSQGWKYEGQPVMVTEFGGIAYKKNGSEGWGYSQVMSDEELIRKYYDILSVILSNPLIQGFCYTQITDVEQEINGIMTYDRKPKVNPEIIRLINEGKYMPKTE